MSKTNICIRYCLKLEIRAFVGINKFTEINWLPTKERFEQCICIITFKFFRNMSLEYVSELYQPIHHGYNTRMSKCKLQLQYRNSNYGQKTISFLGPRLWNKLPAAVKSSANVNTFKHEIENLFLSQLQKKENDIFTYY